ncbi:hypothetical protein BV25DRAFT_1039333 [Artomyces pyxidatus]|uniref:Uncharacterized protein n=1 Tax=Artomyces pyxidatus TaxID=48021 RepID=A0ACB8SUH5_9AGAM|nr:hypothetical protein BV25DRAFT_1039333 [Artomyces pyxidatus]
MIRTVHCSVRMCVRLIRRSTIAFSESVSESECPTRTPHFRPTADDSVRLQPSSIAFYSPKNRRDLLRRPSQGRCCIQFLGAPGVPTAIGRLIVLVVTLNHPLPYGCADVSCSELPVDFFLRLKVLCHREHTSRCFPMSSASAS